MSARAFLFAHPARHSLSPAMHNAMLEALGLGARYEARDVPPEDLRAALEGLRSGAWGANLSIPHKEHALGMLDAVSPEARAIGAVNTVVAKDGALHGFNTDAPGFMRSLEQAELRDFAGLETVVLGAGGAARGVAYALRAAGARVAIWNRTPERAVQLADEFGVRAVSDAQLEAKVRGCALLVNTTAVGLENAHASPLPGGVLPREGWVCDIVYRPLETKLLHNARAAGLGTVDGLGMLVWQGALALEMWLGAQGVNATVNAELMRRAALEALQPVSDWRHPRDETPQ
jgi:shikimate dehydrogenase